MIEFHWKSPFDDPFTAFVKTVVMMSSELDYEALFDNEHASDYQDSKTVLRLFFVLFVVFVAIILMNFMIGVAVSDINDLEMAGNINRLEKQVELLSSLEVLVYNSLFYNMYTKKFGNKKYYMRLSNYVGFQSKWCATLSADFEFQYLDLPSALHDAIVDIAWKKDQINEKNSVVVRDTYKLNALYEAVVDRPLVVATELINEDEANIENITQCQEHSRLNMEMKSLNDGLLIVNNNFKNAMINVNQMLSDTMTMKKMVVKLAIDKFSKNKYSSKSRRCKTELERPWSGVAW